MSRSPDYEVKVGKRVNRGEKSFTRRVGVAFTNNAGGINILIDDGIALVGGEGVQITLWPWEERPNKSGGGKTPPDWDEGSDFNDDVPF